MASIIVTGASRGLGLEFVKQLVKYSKAPKIFALCRNPEKAEQLQSLASSSQNICIVQADMTNYDGYSNVIANIQQQLSGAGVNLLINNAGIMHKDTLKNVTEKNVMDTFKVNSLAPLLFTKAMIPLLKSADENSFPLSVGKSAVINISAQISSIEENTTSGYLSYRISKAALNMITRSQAVELKPYNVFVMAFHPGWVKTDMGGPSAPLTAEASVNSMLTVFSKADETHRGCLFSNKGKKIPW